ncbi:MAG: MFS transporter [Bacteroidetes bacterium]|nr:MFS transporter [Bacteroidota bacterium]
MQEQGLSRSQIIIMAVTAGVCVANIYYNQPILKEIAQSCGVPPDRAGIVSVLSQAGYGLGLFFITPLGDKVNRKKMIIGLMALLVAALVVMVFARTLFLVGCMSLLIGIFGCGAQVILPMAASLDAKNKGKTVGIIFTGIITGILAARVVGGYIAATLGCRYVYGCSAVLVLLSACLVQYSLPDVRPGFAGHYGQLLSSIFLQAKRFALLRRTALLGALIFGTFCSFWTTLTFHLSGAPFYYNAGTIGLFGILAIGGALAAPAIGKLSDKGNAARSQVWTVGLIIAGVLLIKAFPFSLAAFIAAVLLLDIGVQATQVANVATIYSLDASAHSRINTVYMTTYFIGGAFGTWIGIVCWRWGGWSAVTWQLLLWGCMALAIALRGAFIFQKQPSLQKPRA